MKIGIDIDDTIADAYGLMFDFAQEYDIKYLNKEGVIDTEKGIRGFYIGQIYGWTAEETTKFFEIYYKKALQMVKPKMFAAEIIEQLKKEGNQIIIISSRFNNSSVTNINEITKKWMKKYGINYDKLYTEVKDKVEIVKKENIDIYIDDDCDVCEKVSKLNKRVYLMNLESNRRAKENRKITRVYSWIQLKKYLNNL